MKLRINWADPVIPKEEVLQIRPTDMDDFYAAASDLDKSNLFFVLLTSAHYYADREDNICAAHLYFLAANYLFIALTPPGSYDLSLHYMKKTIALNPTQDYMDWLALMEKGN